MIIFVYDASFEGLLSVVFDAYTRKTFPDALLHTGGIAPLLAEHIHTVVADREKASRVFAGLEKRLSRQGARTLLLAWLSGEKDSDGLLFRYIRKTFDSPRPIEHDYADKDVLEVARIAGKVRVELEHMLGFARFQKTADGLYLAIMAPKYDILPLLAPYFAERFADRQWVLYDKGRDYGIFFDGTSFTEAFLPGKSLQNDTLREEFLDKEERNVQELWQKYCQALSIKERCNPILQRRCLPVRYRRYMTEMQKKN